MADLDIAAFLRARFDEREARALAAQGTTEGRWEQEDPVRAHGLIVDDYGDTVTYDEGAPSEAQAVHIADNDPAFVLADVAAKRQILAMHKHTATSAGDRLIEHCTCQNDWSTIFGRYWPCDTLSLLALPYAGHPDYQEGWKP